MTVCVTGAPEPDTGAQRRDEREEEERLALSGSGHAVSSRMAVTCGQSLRRTFHQVIASDTLISRSLVPQSGDWIHPTRSTGRKVARRNRDCAEDECDGGERRWIPGRDVVQQER